MRMAPKPLAWAGILALGLTATAGAGEGRALLIGNADYQRCADLPCCREDVLGISAWLRQAGFAEGQIREVFDANKTVILRELDGLIAECQQHDVTTAIFFYSGHGTFQPDDDGDEPQDGLDEGIMAIENFEPGPNGPPRNLDDIGFIRDDLLFATISRLMAVCPNVIVILDSCYAGGAAKGTANQKVVEKRLTADDLKRIYEAAGLDPPEDPEPTEPARAKSSKVDQLPNELTKSVSSPTSRLLFFGSSNQFQPSLPGNPRSLFTNEFLRLVLPDDPNASPPSWSAADLQTKLRDQTTRQGQDPVVLTMGWSREAFLPETLLPRMVAHTIAPSHARARALLALPPDWQARQTPVLRLDQPSPIRAGERFHVTLVPDRDAFVTLLHISAKGGISLLFPNRFRPAPFEPFPAGEPIELPYRGGLTPGSPFGQERLVAILTDQNPFENMPLAEDIMIGQMESATTSENNQPERVVEAMNKSFRVEPASPSASGDWPWGNWSLGVLTVETQE